MKLEEYQKIVNEKFIDPDEAGQAINYALDDLKLSLSKAKKIQDEIHKLHQYLRKNKVV